METEIRDFILAQPENRQALLTSLHCLILEHDKSVTPVVASMMGMEMILYKGQTLMKYGLASMKQHMTFHVLPMYMNPAIYDTFQKALPNATFQKGCINFSSATQLPLHIFAQLVDACAPVKIETLREKYLEQRKAAKKKGK